ncbi:unnamed protein product [Nezara viridula]|uniref:Uncharacterized protein n=1 Tax=Nezara viridula TaxID=85310 RepID=A0A9P0HPF5_NEZVI|nr:unnamed protein product [Nezara viridula]
MVRSFFFSHSNYKFVSFLFSVDKSTLMCYYFPHGDQCTRLLAGRPLLLTTALGILTDKRAVGDDAVLATFFLGLNSGGGTPSTALNTGCRVTVAGRACSVPRRPAGLSSSSWSRIESLLNLKLFTFHRFYEENSQQRLR